MEYSKIHQKTIEELSEMVKKCTSMKELNSTMKKALADSTGMMNEG